MSDERVERWGQGCSSCGQSQSNQEKVLAGVMLNCEDLADDGEAVRF